VCSAIFFGGINMGSFEMSVNANSKINELRSALYDANEELTKYHALVSRIKRELEKIKSQEFILQNNITLNDVYRSNDADGKKFMMVWNFVDWIKFDGAIWDVLDNIFKEPL
jgi:hypothetical protein